MLRIYVDFDCDGSGNWRKWVSDNSVKYQSATSFPMCGGIRLDGVSHYPENKPEYIRYH